MRKISLLLIAIGAAYALYRIVMAPPVVVESGMSSTVQEQTARGV
jgi:hypothetical protein